MEVSKVKFLLAITTGVISASVAGFGAPSPRDAPVSGSISQDEIAIYDAVLAPWSGQNPERQFVDFNLSAPPSPADPELFPCTKGLRFSSGAQRTEGHKSLLGVHFKRSAVELTDGSKWKPDDPGRAIANGQSVDTAVSQGFAHSLISFSQAIFTDDGKDALVKFSMVCGRLCGSFATIHLHKSRTQWKVANRCSGGML